MVMSGWEGGGVTDGFKVGLNWVPQLQTPVQLIEVCMSLMCIVQQKPWLAIHISQYSLTTHSLLKPTIECSSDEAAYTPL